VENPDENELGRIDAPRRAALRCLLVPPAIRELGWNYGQSGQRYACWIIARAPDERVTLTHCDEGFGPAFPWGYLLDESDGMGMDSQWHAGLEDAAIGAG
jgi:hypothetical protein